MSEVPFTDGKGNSNSHGARPVHLIITMIPWIRTSRLSTKNSFSLQAVGYSYLCRILMLIDMTFVTKVLPCVGVCECLCVCVCVCVSVCVRERERSSARSLPTPTDSDDGFPRDICPIWSCGARVAPTSSLGGLVLAQLASGLTPLSWLLELL